jgi:prevent-host-death family protein
MPQTIMTSREFNQNRSRAKSAAKNGPVIITDRGRPDQVLLDYKEYRELTNKGKSIADLLSMPEGADLDFEFPRSNEKPRLIDFD